MTKKAMNECCRAAMEATDAANGANTHEAHGEAASHHRIAAEACKLMGSDADHEKHKQMAVDHDLAASKCMAAAQNHVRAPGETAEVAAARRTATKPLKAANQPECDGNPKAHCSHCGKDFEIDSAKQRSAENVDCPHCGENVNVTASKKETNDDGDQEAASAARAYGLTRSQTLAMREVMASKSTCAHTNADGTFKDGFDGCVLHMEQCEGHSEASAKKICGAIAQAKANRAYLAKANELVAARLAKSEPLKAAIADDGLSLNDIQSELREEISDIAVLTAPPANAPANGYCGCPWVADVVCPSHEAGETWTAIVRGCDGKLYGVDFTIGDDGEVTVAGDPEEVEQITEYEYLNDFDMQAREAAGMEPLEAMNAQLKGAATKRTNEANALSAAADDATNAANVAQDRETHADAADKHNRARLAHEDAIASHQKAGSEPEHIETHQAMVNRHTAAASAHATKCEACESQRVAVQKRFNELKAGGANPSLNDVRHEVWRLDDIDLDEATVARRLGEREPAKPQEVQAGGTKADAKQPLHAGQSAIDCGKTDDLRSKLDKASDVIMYMPGGIHQITPSQGGKPVRVTVRIDEESAERLESQRQSLTTGTVRPFFSIQHSTQIAAFWPTRFFWDTRLDATGSMVSGVWAEGEWTKSGSEAVEGRDFKTFSPTFFVDKIKDDPEDPAEVVANDAAKLNMGALENDPAFQTISPLWARKAGERASEGELVRECHEELRAKRETTLEDVQSAVFKKHKLRLELPQIARHLDTKRTTA